MGGTGLGWRIGSAGRCSHSVDRLNDVGSCQPVVQPQLMGDDCTAQLFRSCMHMFASLPAVVTHMCSSALSSQHCCKQVDKLHGSAHLQGCLIRRIPALSTHVADADVDAAALHVAGKGGKCCVAAAVFVLAAGGAVCSCGAASAAAPQRFCQRLFCENAWHAVVTAPRRPAERHGIR